MSENPYQSPCDPDKDDPIVLPFHTEMSRSERILLASVLAIIAVMIVLLLKRLGMPELN